MGPRLVVLQYVGISMIVVLGVVVTLPLTVVLGIAAVVFGVHLLFAAMIVIVAVQVSVTALSPVAGRPGRVVQRAIGIVSALLGLVITTLTSILMVVQAPIK